MSVKRFIRFCISATIISLLCSLVVIGIQQSYRQNANDPQIQLAEDTAKSLEEGKNLSFQTSIDMRKSLAPFSILVDSHMHVVSTSALLDGHTVLPPQGVFTTAQLYGQHRITWQPDNSVRIAAVIIPIKKGAEGFLLIGRSLREVERRENTLYALTGIIWLLCILLSGLFILI